MAEQLIHLDSDDLAITLMTQCSVKLAFGTQGDAERFFEAVKTAAQSGGSVTLQVRKPV